MSVVADNNRRIAKNTIFLYIRMLVVTFISVYTVRVTLQALGAEDYGIYNVVCGIIGFMGFITATLNISAQRFLAYELAKENNGRYAEIFSIIIKIFVGLALVIILFAEILGPIMINDYLVIPIERLHAARIIYQISLLTLVVRFVVIPYSASIIANENMNFYAYISIAEVIVKLLIVFILPFAPIDKLIFYAILHFIADLTISSLYLYYCKRNISQCKFNVRIWDRMKVKEIGTFVVWNSFGSLSGVLVTQGMSIITNMFFSPIVITAQAIASRIQSFSYSFVANFITASSPQMTKYYSLGEESNLTALLFRTIKMSFFLMLLISVPLIILAPEVLNIWLGDEVTSDMILFTRITLAGTLLSSIEAPISRAVSATGKVRFYQIVNCISSFVALPIVYMLFRIGYSPIWSYIVVLVLLAISLFYRFAILHKYVKFSYHLLFVDVVLPIIKILILIALISGILVRIIISISLLRLFIIGAMSVGSSIVIIYYLGLNSSEKLYIKNFLFSKFYGVKRR